MEGRPGGKRHSMKFSSPLDMIKITTFSVVTSSRILASRVAGGFVMLMHTSKVGEQSVIVFIRF